MLCKCQVVKREKFRCFKDVNGQQEKLVRNLGQDVLESFPDQI